MITISLKDWSHLTELEKTYYEKQSYENLLSYMANNKIGNTSEYFEEYTKVIKEYQQLCKKLEEEVIIPKLNDSFVFWEVNFTDAYVKVREETN